MIARRFAVALTVFHLSRALLAQATTGTITGVVTSESKPLGGVTVSITSPALQGIRTATTGPAGGYSFANLLPGDYLATFEFPGMQSVHTRVSVDVSTSTRADAELKAGVFEQVTVTAAPPAAESAEVATNFKMEMVNQLPTLRTINAITLLAPGVTDAGPNNQITISGAPSYDSMFLVNGVVVNENVRGQPNPLYIEDAIQETTVLTGAISAEFGRFTGGVVSTITKSGGNALAGSLRDTLTNPSWTKKTAFPGQNNRRDALNHQFEGTLGGRVIRDRLWFFTAGRYNKTDRGGATTFTNIQFGPSEVDRRYEAKLTSLFTAHHSVTGSYISEHDRFDKTVAGIPARAMDLRSLVPFDRARSLLSLNYTGIVATNLLLEGQLSRMRDRFTNGGEDRTLENGTPLIDLTSGNRMWASVLCGTVCPAKQRYNNELLAKASYFLSSRKTGNHSIVGGIDEFHQLRNENNYGSGSDYRLRGTILCNKGGVAVACASLTTSQLTTTDVYFGIATGSGTIEYDPVLALSNTSDFAVRSLFVNDKWDLNAHWSFNAGARYDKAFGKDQAGNKTVDDDAISPRLAANFDPLASGRHRFSVTYGRYVSKVDQGPADSTSTAGTFAAYYWDYKGPAINAAGTPISQLLPSSEVIQRVFDWFNSVGGTKAGPPLLTGAVVPGTTSRFDHSLQAPYMDEVTAGYGLTLSRGFVRADYIQRKWAAFYSIRRNTGTGKAVDANGTTFDQGVIENSDAGLSRNYHAMQLQGSWHPRDSLTAGGNYTWSRLRGNVEGETAGGGTALTSFQNYPEYTSFAQFNPDGDLSSDIRHHANLWFQYDLPPTRFGSINFSILERYHSALSYSAIGTIDVRAGSANGPTNGIVNPGYSTPPASVTYFFSDRGAFRLDDISSTDLGLTWSLPSFRGVRGFLETEMTNIFNRQGVEDPDIVNQTVVTRRQTTCLQTGSTARCLAFNPFTDTPKLGVNWQYGPTFGQPAGATAYQQPRSYRFSVGLKF